MTSNPHRLRLLAVPVAVALLLLGGCGDDDSTADEPTGASDTSESTDGSSDTGESADPDDDSGDPDNTADDSDDDSGEPDDKGDDSDDKPDDSDESTPSAGECIGDDAGAFSLETGSPTKLPGGGDASLGSTDFESDPPTASLELGDATAVERDNASGLAVGDQFGLQRSVYKVVGICPDSVMLDEF